MAMRVPEWEEYLKSVLSFVKFKYDHNAIYFELLGHMEERYEDLVAEGMEEQAAKEMTVLRMGDAKEVGKALNKVHNPLLGWIWLCLRRVMQFTIVINILPLLGVILTCIFSVFDFVPPKTDSPIVYEIAVDKKIKVHDQRLYIKDVTYYEDKTLAVTYATFTLPFSKNEGWTWSIGITVDGEASNGSGRISGGYGTRGRKEMKNVSEDAKELTIEYAYKQELTIDLTEGRVMAE